MVAGLLMVSGGAARGQLLPFEENQVKVIDPGQAFVEGYRTYQQGDYAAALGPMQLASRELPQLADYALFFLGDIQAKEGDKASAVASYRQVFAEYPQSVFAEQAELEYARGELQLGHAGTALTTAAHLAAQVRNRAVAAQARLIIAQGAFAQHDYATAYRTAQALRAEYPREAADAAARALTYRSLSLAPSLKGPVLAYHYKEARLLVEEGQADAALAQVRSALALEPPPAMREELCWFRARASRGDAARTAWMQLLILAPHGAHAAAAASTLAHLYWRSNDTAMARSYFRRVVGSYPHSAAAPEASFDIGRTYEDDGNLVAARTAYVELIERYPASAEADQARFRAPFMLYEEGRYHDAAAEFSRARRRAAANEVAMYEYWEGRALSRTGDLPGARAAWESAAHNLDSNYYPLLASRLVAVSAPQPAASAAALERQPAPQNPGSMGFHLERVAALQRLNLPELEWAELCVIGQSDQAALRRFALAEMQATGAWYDAIELAGRMAADGEISAAVAERIRYPQGYRAQIDAAAARNQLDPWLVAALIRQESLYNPRAQSVSDARGLMQLLPATAAHWAPAAGLSPVALNLYDPEISLRIGTTYLKGLMDMFGGNEFRAVAAYNGGENAVARWVKQFPGDDDQWVENIGYRETRDYVKKVIGGTREYRLLYGGAVAVRAQAGSSG